METVKVSSKFQVVIPKGLRESMGLKVGEELGAYLSGQRIELVRVRPLKDMLGIYKGHVNDFEREKKDREF